jgi:hypothetical protein
VSRKSAKQAFSKFCNRSSNSSFVILFPPLEFAWRRAARQAQPVQVSPARAQKGKRIGRPAADPALISELKGLVASGKSLRQVSTMLGVSVVTAHKYGAVAAAN